MRPDLTPEIDAGLAKMEALIARMRGKVKPSTAKRTRLAFKACVADLEDSAEIEPVPEETAVVSRPAPARARPTTFLIGRTPDTRSHPSLA